jgi:putative ABC transport system permease protein
VILLTLRDLAHRVVRFVVVSALGAVVFALLFVMTGLVEQFNREPYLTVDAIGAAGWVLADGIAGPFTAASSLPVDTIDAIDADVVAPVVAARSSLVHQGASEEIVLIGANVGGLGQPTVVDGREVATDGEAIVDESIGIEVGTTVDVAGRPFQVVGLSTDTTVLAGIPLVFVTTSAAQQLVFRSEGVVSGFLVDGDVRAVPDGAALISGDDVAADTLGPLEGAIASVDLVRALLWVVAAIIVGSVVYLSALDRQRDVAVLKAMGVSNRTLLTSLALQAVLVAVVSVVVAIGLQAILAPAFPLRVRVPTRAYWQLPLLAVVMALVASAAGLRRVARADPALAFAGAGG